MAIGIQRSAFSHFAILVLVQINFVASMLLFLVEAKKRAAGIQHLALGYELNTDLLNL